MTTAGDAGAIARTFAVLLPGAAVYHALVSLVHLAVLPAGVRGLSAVLAGGTSVGLVGAALWAHRRPDAVPPVATALATAVGGLVVANAIGHVLVVGDPLHAITVVLVVLGAGLLLPSPPAFVGVAATAWAGFLLAAATRPAPGWDHLALALIAATALAATAHVRHRRSADRLQALRATQADALQRALDAKGDAEARYRALVSLSPDPVVLVEGDRIAAASPTATALVGAPLDAIVGAPALDFLHPADRHLVKAWGDRPGVHAVRARSRTGNAIPVEIHTAPIEREGRPAILLVVRDGRARRAAEALRREILASIEHEVRTPLTSVLGAIGLLTHDPDGEVGPRARRLVDIAARNADRLQDLVEDLLNLQRLETRSVALRPVPIGAVLEPLVARAPREVHLGGDVDATVVGDPFHLEALFRALLDDMATRSPEGAGIDVDVARGPETVRVAVRPRNAEGLRERIVGPFHGGSAPTARRPDRTGSGLAIARGIVEAHGGHIDVANHPDGSARLLVDLPAPMPPARHADTPAA